MLLLSDMDYLANKKEKVVQNWQKLALNPSRIGVRRGAGDTSASIQGASGIRDTSGPKIEALRRFDGDGFSGIGVRMAIFAQTGAKSRLYSVSMES